MPPLLRALLIVLVSGVLSRASLPVASAQTTNAPTITDIVIEGDADTLIDVHDLGVPTGAVLSRQLVRDLIHRLTATGRWTDVQVRSIEVPDGVRLVLSLSPRASLSRMELRGVVALDTSEVAREVELQAGTQLSAEVIERAKTRVLALYARRGYRQARVNMLLRDTDDPTLKVLLVVLNEGEPTRITRVIVQGDQALDPRALPSALSFSVGDILDQTSVTENVRRAERRLRRAGYLEATLQEPVVEVNGARAEVVIPTHVGPLYRVEIRGQRPMSRAAVLEALGLGEEPLTSPAQVGAVSDRVLNLYHRLGFVDAAVTLRQRPARGSGSAGRAVLQVDIVTGAQLEIVAIGFPGARHFQPTFLEDEVKTYLDEELPGGSVVAPVDSDVVDDATVGPGANHRQSPLPLNADPTRTFYEPAYDSAIEHIAQLYQADGYLAARVGPAQLQRTARNRAVVAIPVTEGPRTTLYALKLSGNEALGAQELVSESGLRRAMPFSYLALEEARLRVLQVYKERGYLYAKVEPTVAFSQDRTRAEVTIEVVERYQVQVEAVVIRGADRTDEGLIRDLVEFNPGDVYRPSVAQESEERLLALGVFSGVTIAPEEAELPARSKRVEVTVTQRPSQVIDLKAGISTGQGIRGGLEYGYRDLFGQAVSLTVRAELAYQFFFVQQVIADRYNRLLLQDRLERNVTLSLVVPQLFRGTGVRTTFEIYHVRDNQRDYGLDKNGVGLGLNYQPARRLTLTLNGDLENNNIDIFAKVASIDDLIRCLLMSDDPRDRSQALGLQRTRVPDGNSVLISSRFAVSYDHRDNPFSPTSGYYTSISSEVARTLKTEEAKINSQFVKVSITGTGYVPLGRKVVLALQARGGYIFHLLPRCADNPGVECSQTYPNRAFFIGGIDTMRGYFQDAMVPQDQIAAIVAAANTPVSSDPNMVCDPDDPTSPAPGDAPIVDANAIVRSGDAFVLYRAELRFPIVGDLYGATFTDIGNLWSNPRLLNPFQVRASVGAGVRLATPVGPLALDYGIVVGARQELGEPTYGTVHFSMGLF